MELCGCDTFVVMADASATGEVIFGKNSDRPSGEVQEIIYTPHQEHNEGTNVKCTYIEIRQATTTYATVLSKPAWMWGAEMGANEAGVVIGNEAVWDRLSDEENDLVPRLLGMDLLRLGLERSKSACEAVDVIVNLLEKHGQGGDCSETIKDFTYHNSFLIADPTEAWVLETADRFWVAEKVLTGHRNISNCMSITTKIDKCSSGLKLMAEKKGWWDGKSEFNWSHVIGSSCGDLVEPTSRWSCGRQLLREMSGERKFNVTNMMSVLRDEESGIHMSEGSFITTSSQVSVLSKCAEILSCHWFTGTPKPLLSVFKPFMFSGDVGTGNMTVSPEGNSLRPRQRKHPLWAAHGRQKWTSSLCNSANDLEKKFVVLAEEGRQKDGDKKCLFASAVAEEIKIYDKQAD